MRNTRTEQPSDPSGSVAGVQCSALCHPSLKTFREEKINPAPEELEVAAQRGKAIGFKTRLPYGWTVAPLPVGLGRWLSLRLRVPSVKLGQSALPIKGHEAQTNAEVSCLAQSACRAGSG